MLSLILHHLPCGLEIDEHPLSSATRRNQRTSGLDAFRPRILRCLLKVHNNDTMVPIRSSALTKTLITKFTKRHRIILFHIIFVILFHKITHFTACLKKHARWFYGGYIIWRNNKYSLKNYLYLLRFFSKTEFQDSGPTGPICSFIMHQCYV